MLFNSYDFILIFLPFVLLAYIFIRDFFHIKRASFIWLIAASLVFYGYWRAEYAVLVIVSIMANLVTARMIADAMSAGRQGAATLMTGVGIAANLGVLGYFKYTGFAVDVLRSVGLTDAVVTIVLPIGISFFTFQQIAFLVDVRRGQATDLDPVRYALFVTFFPQLIAGPIVHHRETMSQFAQERAEPAMTSIAIGAAIFACGLFKKLAIADTAAIAVDPVFAAAENGLTINAFDAWGAALGYTAQLYFDFSGYSDMAVGLARMFGVVLPINFAAPYSATSIVDFWRRWHITLSRFLRDYLYIPLGGDRHGSLRRYANVLVTMVLGGLWHGAGWTFIVWGGVHGVLIVINQLWSARRRGAPGVIGRWLGWAATMVCVTLAWMVFRAETLGGAVAIYSAMADVGGLAAGPERIPQARVTLAVVALSLVAAALAPTLYDVLRDYRPGLASPGYPATDAEASSAPRLRLTTGVALLLGCALAVSLVAMNAPAPFLYFQF